MLKIFGRQGWHTAFFTRLGTATLMVVFFSVIAALADSKSPGQGQTDTARAMQDYNDSIAINVNDAMLFYHRAKLWEQLGNDAAALKDINQAIEFNPNQAKFYLARAFLEHKQGKAVLVRQDIQRAQFADPLLSRDIQFLASDQNEDRYLQDAQLTDVHNINPSKTMEKPQVVTRKPGTTL